MIIEHFVPRRRVYHTRLIYWYSLLDFGFMRKDYKEGTRIKMLFTQEPGVIVKSDDTANDFKHYLIRLDKGTELMITHNEIAEEGHPILDIIKKWKSIMAEKGYRCMLVGIDRDQKLWAFFFTGEKEYLKIKESNPNVRFIWFWSLNN